jgi:hypothetical protein
MAMAPPVDVHLDSRVPAHVLLTARAGGEGLVGLDRVEVLTTSRPSRAPGAKTGIGTLERYLGHDGTIDAGRRPRGMRAAAG